MRLYHLGTYTYESTPHVLLTNDREYTAAEYQELCCALSCTIYDELYAANLEWVQQQEKDIAPYTGYLTIEKLTIGFHQIYPILMARLQSYGFVVIKADVSFDAWGDENLIRNQPLMDFADPEDEDGGHLNQIRTYYATVHARRKKLNRIINKSL